MVRLDQALLNRLFRPGDNFPHEGFLVQRGNEIWTLRKMNGTTSSFTWLVSTLWTWPVLDWKKFSGPWPLDLPQLERTMELTGQQGLQELLLLHLVSRVLLAGRKAPGWLKGWLRRQEVFKGVAPDLSFKTALSMDWSAVPVPCGGDRRPGRSIPNDVGHPARGQGGGNAPLGTR